VLVLVDGRRSVRDILAGRPLVPTLRDLALLAEQGVIVFDSPAETSSQAQAVRRAMPTRVAARLVAVDMPVAASATNGANGSASAALSHAPQLSAASDTGRGPARHRLALTGGLLAVLIAAAWLVESNLGAPASEPVPAPMTSVPLQAVAAPTVAGVRAPALGGIDAAPTSAPQAPLVVATSPVARAPLPTPGEPTPTPSASRRVLMDVRFAQTPGAGWVDNPPFAAWRDGAYRLQARQPAHFVAVNAPFEAVPDDVIVSGTFRKTGGPPGGGYGLIVRDAGPQPRDGANQEMNAYVFEAGDLGEFGVWRRDGDHWVDLVPWTRGASVRPGGSPNELSVHTSGGRLVLTINGVQAAAVNDPILPYGRVGVIAGGDFNEVAVDRFTVQVPN
jgi:hypothetical protein